MQQMTFGFDGNAPGWGGARKGAGRKPSGPRPRVSHAKRRRVTGRRPLHVTMRVCEGLPSLRTVEARELIWRMFRVVQDEGFRIVHFAILSNHLHLIVEADGDAEYRRGMRRLTIRLAKNLNKLWGRKGRVLEDRYHEVLIETPTQARHALRYVLNNALKHGVEVRQGIDCWSSAGWFDGWCRPIERTGDGWPPCPVSKAKTYLMTRGWRERARYGKGDLWFDDLPAACRERVSG